MSHDSIIYKTIRNKEDTQKQQEDLTSAAKWEKDWLMLFHPDKCSVFQVTTKLNPIKFDYTLHQHVLQKETSTKYLGSNNTNRLEMEQNMSITSQHQPHKS